ncbi:hypothetical protein FAZ95_11845 [Trinickia violacea]|uniref:Baseplate protein J-like domain-containing protein n=1 Tax=Trinickia violacea TaxID=2571746 RepID=A0A4P8IQA5_9BURK|nr:hypothetical protein [Trinickia violacea]QCP49805.1 hypothetical protein FAZ95_11845 [Trinickia violacea]
MADIMADERDFDDLVREGLALLPVYAPEWTDHNPSDPGVTLVELLAYFSDLLLYRVGRVTPAAKLQFLRLINGASRNDAIRTDSTEPDALQRALDSAVAALAQPACAITASDFEGLALAAARRHAPADTRFIARCVVDADLADGRQRGADWHQPGHVSVIVAALDDLSERDAARLRTNVRRYLLPRCLLTTRLHVVAPDDLYVGLGLSVALRPGAALPAVAERIATALRQRFDGADAAPALGVTLNLTEVARVVDDLPGVDYVEDVTVLQLGAARAALSHAEAGVGVQLGRRATIGVDTRIGGASPYDGERLIRDSEGVLASVRLKPWERLRLGLAHDGLREIEQAVRSETGRRGRAR